MAYPPPQGNFSYQRAYPPNYDQEPYPPPIGFQNYVAANPNNQTVQSAYPPTASTTVAYHGTPEAQHRPQPKENQLDDVPKVGFEKFSRRPNPPSAQSASGVALENVEDLPRDFPNNEQLDEQLSDNSTTRIELDNQSKPLYFRDGRRKIDYILAYQEHPDKPTEWQEKRKEKRNQFEENLKEQGLELEQEDCEASLDAKTFYIKVHAPWHVLANGAEEMMMRMPTIENDLETPGLIDKIFGCFGVRNPFDISEEDVPTEPNVFTCAFKRDRLENFKGHENKETFFNSSQRSLIVYRLLKSTHYDPNKRKIGVDRLVSNLSYTAAYPLHEGYHKPSPNSERTERQILYDVWAKFKRFYKKQPLNLIRKYFGEKVGIYFAWLGFYTILLFPAAVVGVINVIYGLASLGDYTPTNIICNESLKTKYAMCPRCDKKCDYFPLYDACGYSRAAYVFDNDFTIVFAVFMSLWSTMFLEFWKRRQVEIAYYWDLLGFEDEEEATRPEYEVVCTEYRNNPITQESTAVFAPLPSCYQGMDVIGMHITLAICSFFLVCKALVEQERELMRLGTSGVASPTI